MRPVTRYRLRNIPHRLRGLDAEIAARLPLPRGMVAITSELRAKVLRHRPFINRLIDLREFHTADRYMSWINTPEEERWRIASDPRYLQPSAAIELCGLDWRLRDCVEDLGVISRRLVTDGGVDFLTDAFTNTVELELLNYHSSGTDNTAEAQTDIALAAPVAESRDTGAQSQPDTNQYRTVATHTYASGFTIVEHGIFSQLAPGGTLWDRSVFAGIPVANTDSIEFTYTNTSNAGG